MAIELSIEDVVVEFKVPGKAAAKPSTRRALDSVSLEVMQGESFGLVGESGCGKSTTANVIMGLATPVSGSVTINGELMPAHRTAAMRRHTQMVFQDPASSLNPRRRVGSVLEELITTHQLATKANMQARLTELMDMVGLPTSVLSALPSNLSGGQRQRVAIARALAVEPRLLIADEAVSALDVSAQAKVINLLADLKEQLGLTLIFISHDLAVVRTLCDRAAVMNSGQVVEVADTETLFTQPQHPYTRELIASIPQLPKSGRH